MYFEALTCLPKDGRPAIRTGPCDRRSLPTSSARAKRLFYRQATRKAKFGQRPRSIQSLAQERLTACHDGAAGRASKQ
jgi:hypothetical protein